MNNNKMYLNYEEIIIPLPQNHDLSEMLDRAGYDFEGTHIKTVCVIDRGFYRFPVVLMSNRVFYSDDIITKYYRDIDKGKAPEEINANISNYAMSHLFSSMDNKTTKRY